MFVFVPFFSFISGFIVTFTIGCLYWSGRDNKDVKDVLQWPHFFIEKMNDDGIYFRIGEHERRWINREGEMGSYDKNTKQYYQPEWCKVLQSSGTIRDNLKYRIARRPENADWVCTLTDEKNNDLASIYVSRLNGKNKITFGAVSRYRVLFKYPIESYQTFLDWIPVIARVPFLRRQNESNCGGDSAITSAHNVYIACKQEAPGTVTFLIQAFHRGDIEFAS